MQAMQLTGVGIMAANDEPCARVIGPLEGQSHLGGDGMAMLADAVTAWVKAAAPGQQIVYATGHLPAWSKGPGRMRDLACEGYVHLVCDRKPDPKQYVAQRTSMAWREEAAPQRRIARAVASYEAEVARLYDVLRELAAEGAPCPSNAELAREIGLETAQQGAYALSCLVKADKVINRPVEGPPYRVITIVSGGRRTGLVGGAA